MEMKIEETLIIKIGFLGMAEEAQGLATFSVTENMTDDEFAEQMGGAFQKAGEQAARQLSALYEAYLKERLGLED